MSLVPLVAIALIAGAPESALLVSVRPVGLGAEGVKAVTSSLEAELGEAGVAFSPAPAPVDASCLERPACLQGRLAGAPALLHVELLRVGPFVQVSASLYGPDGEKIASREESAEAEGFPKGTRLLDEALLAAARERAPVVVAEAGPASNETEVIEVAPSEQPAGPAQLPVLGYSGIGVAVAGGLLTLGGGALALYEASVLEDAASLGDDKARARVLGPVALGAAAAGVLVLGAGGALSSIGFAE